MEITRKQLRKIISDSINEYRIKPSVGDHELDKSLYRLSRSDSEESKAQAGELAPQLGYPGDYVKDVEEYDTIGMYKTLGPLSRYLSSESREAINRAYNKNLLLTKDYRTGDFNVEDADTGMYVVLARELKKAAMEIQLKDPDYNPSEIDWDNYLKSKERELTIKLIIEIINNSKITKVSAYQFTLIGAGEYKRNQMGKVSEISLEGSDTADIFANHLDTTRLIAIGDTPKDIYGVRTP